MLEQDRVEEAVGAWLRAALLDSTDHTAAFNAATALRLAGRNQHAETFYRRAVQLQPKVGVSLPRLFHMLREMLNN